MILLVNFSSIPTINKDLVPSFFILGERIATFLFAELFFFSENGQFRLHFDARSTFPFTIGAGVSYFF